MPLAIIAQAIRLSTSWLNQHPVEAIFGFPHQAVRLIHDSIRREAFGTGAAFALQELAQRDKGFYSFDDLLLEKIRTQRLTTA